MGNLEERKKASDTDTGINDESAVHMTARQLKALETKKSLYESAIKLFAEKGFNDVSIDEIAAEAGTSKGSFYTYFNSKSHVMYEQFKQFDNNYMSIYKNLSYCKTSQEKLLYFAKYIYTFAVEEIGLDITKVVYSNGFQYGQEESAFVTDESRPLYKIIGEIVRKGIETKEFVQDYSEKELTIMIVRCIGGTYLDWCLYGEKFDLVSEGVRFLLIFLNGIKEKNKTS